MKRKTFISGVLFMTLILSFFTPTANAAQKGEKTFGVHTGYVSRNNSADLGLYFQYTFSDHFRLQPSADIIFRHHDREAFTIDLNAQVPIGFDSDKFSLYPFAGINFSSWNRHQPIFEFVPDEGEGQIIYEGNKSTRSNNFGVNLGAGFDLKISSTLKLSIEGGYTFVKRNSGVKVLVGLGYIF